MDTAVVDIQAPEGVEAAAHGPRIQRTPWRMLAFPVVAGLAVNGAFVLIVAFQLIYSFWVILQAFRFSTVILPLLFLGSGYACLLGGARYRMTRAARIVAFAWVGLAFLIPAVRVYSTEVEPQLLSVRTEVIKTSKVKSPVRILHISDFQSAAIGAYERRAVAMMRELHPDLIIHTGDVIQPLPPESKETMIPKVAELFGTLKPPLGFFNAEGDCDPRIKEYFDSGIGGMRTVFGEQVLKLGDNTIRLYGLDLRQSRRPQAIMPLLAEWEKNAGDDFTILMGHAPDYALSASALPIDLCLAGHTHGGQISIPFFGPPLILSSIPRSWARGFRTVRNTRLDVSPGVGGEHSQGLPTIRFNCPPEMTLIILEPESP